MAYQKKSILLNEFSWGNAASNGTDIRAYTWLTEKSIQLE